MKKVLFLVLVVCLGLSITGATCLNNFQGKVCNPTPEAIATGNTVLDFLKPIANTLLPGTAAFDAYVTAQNIANGMCVGSTALTDLINFVQGINTAKSLVGAKAPAINVAPLLAWQASIK